MKKLFGFVCILMILFSLFLACASAVPLEEFNEYRAANQNELKQLQAKIDKFEEHEQVFVSKTEFEQQVKVVEESIKGVQVKLNHIELALSEYAKNESLTTLKKDCEKLAQEFTGAYNSIDEFVRLAGYKTSDDFLTLGRDIVRVNENIKEIDEKIENLRAAMALFVKPEFSN